MTYSRETFKNEELVTVQQLSKMRMSYCRATFNKLGLSYCRVTLENEEHVAV